MDDELQKLAKLKQDVEARRVGVFQEFCNQYNKLLDLLMHLEVKDVTKLEISRKFRDAFLEAKEAIISANFSISSDTEQDAPTIEKNSIDA